MAQATAAGTKGLPELELTAYFIPISVIALWPPSDPAHIQRRHWYIPYAISLLVLASLCLATRFYAQYTRRIRQFGADDILIIIAWLFGIAFTVVTCWGVLYAGFDTHIWDNVLNGERAGFTAWLSELIFLSSTCLTKLSVLAFQRRLIQRTYNPKVTRALDAAILFTIMYFLAFLMFLPLSCTPANAAWKSMDISYNKPYKCVHRNVADIVVGVLSVISDVVALIVPEFIIYQLRMEKSKKIVLYIVFSCGIFVSGAGVARTYWLGQLSSDRLRDLAWVGYEIMVWGQLELQLALVCASAPALKAFISNVKSGTTRVRTYKSSYVMDENRTALTRSKIERSNIDSVLRDDLTAEKGILVTETLSMNSAVVTPISNTPKRLSQTYHNLIGVARPISVEDVHRGTSSSSQSPLQKPPRSPSPVYPIDPVDSAPYPTEHYLSRIPSYRANSRGSRDSPGPTTFRSQADRAKAMRVMGG